MRRAKKEAYFQYVYHTVAIEGNTMNLAQTRSILETKLGTGNVCRKPLVIPRYLPPLAVAILFIRVA